MNDTVKLIIEIPKAEYECAKQRWMSENDAHKMDYYMPQWMKETDAHKMDYYISNGIPLDDVKTEKGEGEWILKERTTECSIDIDIVCSRCGYVGIENYTHGYELNEIDMQEVRDYTKKLDMNFCTCCGADMRGE